MEWYVIKLEQDGRLGLCSAKRAELPLELSRRATIRSKRRLVSDRAAQY